MKQTPGAFALNRLRGDLVQLGALAQSGHAAAAALWIAEAERYVGLPPLPPPNVDRATSPSKLFQAAFAHLEETARFRGAEIDALINCWTALRAARSCWLYL